MIHIVNNLLSPKQLEFINHATHKINIAEGPVRSGKTVGTLLAFMHAAFKCPDSQIWMIGHTASTIFDNAVRLLLESNTPNNPLAIFYPFITWNSSRRILKFHDKTISTVGVKDQGAIGLIQGKTYSLAYCDEITLYPDSIIDMISTRLSNPHSKLIGTCNPSHPTHKIKQWIDKAYAGDKDYYSLQFTLDDNPYLNEDYKQRLRNSLSGLFYKRNYLGLWCLAQGAIFDFFDPVDHVKATPPRAAEYWIAAIDFGMQNACAALVIGVNTGINPSSGNGRCLWVENEYYWSVEQKGRQKLVGELAQDIMEFFEPYAIKNTYIDPSALALSMEFRRKGYPLMNAENDVIEGIKKMTSEMFMGNLFVMDNCKNLIKEIQGYVWDLKAAERGDDKPVKKNDHLLDCLRYAIYTHKVPEYNPYKNPHDSNNYIQNRFGKGGKK